MTVGHPLPSSGSSDLQFTLPESRTHFGAVFGGASVTHVALLAVLSLFLWLRPDADPTLPVTSLVERTMFVFEARPGPQGGGGGGGDRSRERMRTSPELAIRRPESIMPAATIEPESPVTLEPAAIVPAATPNNLLPAMVEAGPATVGALGPGTGPGAGPGDHIGIGPSRGGGAGPGDAPGCCGDGAFGGASAPVPIVRPRPSYTAEAMQRGLRGEVGLSCLVLESGSMGPCQVVRPLDGNVYGLDDQALKSAAGWKFTPGMRDGKPVPVRVNIIIEFNLR